MYGNTAVFIAAVSTVFAASFNNQIRSEMPENCKGDICFEKSPDYPQELIDMAISKSLGDNIEIGDHTQQRDGFEKPQDDCKRIIKFEPIYHIKDKDGNVRFVAQSDKLLQKVRTEECENPGRITTSRFFEPNELERYNFTCQQKNMDYSFLVLSLDGTRLEDVDVNSGLPVCCSCQYNI